MTRVVVKEAKAPYVYKEGDPKGICMCGISKNQPFCDGTHSLARDEEEGKLYSYENEERKEVEIK